MKHALAAAAAALTLAGAARADFTVDFGGPYVFEGSHGVALTVDSIQGTLQGIRVSFTYANAAGSSQAYDVAFTVNQSQWGGYQPFINGAQWGERPTGAPTEPGAVSFTSGNLGIGYGVAFNNQPALVGFGNANLGGGCTLSNVQITLLGVVPAPGAGAAVGLAGVCALRRRRR